ncbi:MAG TPA: CHAT domain-containing protein [Stellaceae bacterium]|jgi:CHAT domain-containing protein
MTRRGSVLWRKAGGGFVAALIAVTPLPVQAQSPATPNFVPPPRSIADITAILDQEKPDPAKIAKTTAAADAQSPAGIDDRGVIDFLVKRGDAAAALGRSQQALTDLRKAVEVSRAYPGDAGALIGALSELSRAERRAGNVNNMLQDLQEASADALASRQRLGTLFPTYRDLAVQAVQLGKANDAVAWLKKLDQTLQDSASWRGPNIPRFRTWYKSFVDEGHAAVLNAAGNFAQAEVLYRSAIAEAHQAEKDTAGLAGTDNTPPPGVYTTAGDLYEVQFAGALAANGRLMEAEVEAREALLSQLQMRGRYAPETTVAVVALGRVVGMQGRYADAEKLLSAAVSTYQTLGVAANSTVLIEARSVLASNLLAENNPKAAMDQYRAIEVAVAGDSRLRARYLDANPDYAITQIDNGHATNAIAVAQTAIVSRTAISGPASYATAEATGIYAAALAAARSGAALDGFSKAIPVLLAGARHNDIEEDDASAGYQIVRLQFILESYLDLLASDHSAIGAAEAFRIADAARGQSVQHAVTDAAARARVTDPALADVVRQDQDAQRQVTALDAVLAGMLAIPSDQRDAAAVAQTRASIEKLLVQRTTTREDVRKRFPGYARLIDPLPATVADAQRALAPAEALVSIYVGEKRAYVWAMPKQGAIAFAASPLSPGDIDKAVASLRKSVDPDAATAGQIPAFDVANAYKLYAGLLEPVKAGWQGASDLLVVANGTLGEVPFGMLATQNVKPAPDQSGQPLFTGYKTVPWLIRQVAITQLPSVTSWTTLRATPAPKIARKPFIGFGDPWFNQKEEAQAIAQQGMALAMQVASGGLVAMRKAPVHLRSAPRTEDTDDAKIGELPRLPDTADEVKEVAAALKADFAKDVYLGAQANEQVVRTVDLDDRRVVMFATHGLVPGDLDGLTEPALALSAPDVAKVPGDGLLTVSKILGLRLNADWVVLSACNTAAAGGAGAEAVSGLGLAFFYAGSRTLLVSNWPVETVSARILTTELFKREAASPGIAREALRQAMLSLIDGPGMIEPATQKSLYSYAHPLFWAPFSLVGDGGPG